MTADAGDERLARVLGAGRAQGYLGPAPIAPQIEHARAMGRVVDGWGGRSLDLGSGGGLPGLVLAVSHPASRWLLLDAHGGRCRFLEWAVAELDLTSRVEVFQARAEEAGRRPELREAFALVTARAFGSPAVTAECGSALTAPGGRLVVSEPPDPDPGRWPVDDLAALGLRQRPVSDDGRPRLAVFDKVQASPERVPRRTGVPAKRPLF